MSDLCSGRVQCIWTTCPSSQRLPVLSERLGTFQTAGFTAGTHKHTHTWSAHKHTPWHLCLPISSFRIRVWFVILHIMAQRHFRKLIEQITKTLNLRLLQSVLEKDSRGTQNNSYHPTWRIQQWVHIESVRAYFYRCSFCPINSFCFVKWCNVVVCFPVMWFEFSGPLYKNL